jgi:hypothetical protein
MRCGNAIESCGSEWFQSALAATISTTPVSHFVGSVQARHDRNSLRAAMKPCLVSPPGTDFNEYLLLDS